MAGEKIKFSQLDAAPELSDVDYYVGIKLNEGGETYTNYRYSARDMAEYFKQKSRKVVVVSSDGTDLTDAWIDGKDIQAIGMNGQLYVLDEDFTQAGDTITGNGIRFTTGQKVFLMS